MNLQDQLDEVISQMANETDPSVLAGLEQRKAVYTMQLEDGKAQEAATQERIQAQVEKVESITLPYNFSELFGNEDADAMIIELIRDFQHQAYAEHNAEVELLIAENKAQVAELKVKNDELQSQVHDLSYDLEGADNTIANLNTSISQLKIERDDAYSKRDAAVREKEGIELLLAEKQSHIDTLRNEIAVGAKAAINITNISPSDRLAALVEQSKNAKVKSAIDIALENPVPFRGKVISDGAVVQLNAPEVPTFQAVDTSSDTGYQLVTGPTVEVSADDQVTPSEDSLQTISTGLVEGSPSENGQAVEKTLEERVKALELHVFGA